MKRLKLFEDFNESIKPDATFNFLEKWLKDTRGEFSFEDLEAKMINLTDDDITLGQDKKAGEISFDNNGEWIGTAGVTFNGDKIVLPAKWVDAKEPEFAHEGQIEKSMIDFSEQMLTIEGAIKKLAKTPNIKELDGPYKKLIEAFDALDEANRELNGL